MAPDWSIVPRADGDEFETSDPIPWPDVGPSASPVGDRQVPSPFPTRGVLIAAFAISVAVHAALFLVSWEPSSPAAAIAEPSGMEVEIWSAGGFVGASAAPGAIPLEDPGRGPVVFPTMAGDDGGIAGASAGTEGLASDAAETEAAGAGPSSDRSGSGTAGSAAFLVSADTPPAADAPEGGAASAVTGADDAGDAGDGRAAGGTRGEAAAAPAPSDGGGGNDAPGRGGAERLGAVAGIGNALAGAIGSLPLDRVSGFVRAALAATTAGEGPAGDAFAGSVTQAGNYRGQVFARIRRAPPVPDEARQRRLKGSPLVGFTIRADGELDRVRILRTSGHAIIDRAAVSMVRIAAPFPPIPAGFRRSSMSFQVRLYFDFRK